jgi:hypothetical protein
MIKVLVWLIKFPFVLVGAVLAFTFGLVGVVLSILGVALTPVLGVGLLILPIGLLFLFFGWGIAQLFKRRKTVVIYRQA